MVHEMGVQDTVAWYQKKIGTYDKQQWELSFERHIIRGYNHVKTKSARLKTELIDVDLVQGSSFSKAKPKHGFLMVAWLATLRLLFYPLYIRWWASQTSKKGCILLTALYLLQLITILIYILKDTEGNFYENLSCTVVVIPLVIMWILCFIHSQIIATNSEPSRKKPTIFQNKVAKNVNFQPFDEISATVPRVEDITGYNKCIGVATSTRQVKSQSNIDDGFESFNGVGSNSSDNGEESIVFSSIHLRSQNSHGNNVENGWSSGTDDTSDEFKRKKTLGIVSKKAIRIRLGRNASENERIKSKISNDAEKYPSEEEDEEEEDEGNTESQTSTRRFTCSCKVKCASNSEENYYATELDQSEGDIDDDFDLCFNPDYSTFDKVSCTIWDKGDVKKAYLTVLDITSAIIRIVEQMPECIDYFYLGLIFSLMLAFTPVVYRLSTIDGSCCNSTSEFLINVDDLVQSRLDNLSAFLISVFNKALGNNFWERLVMLIASLQRFILASVFFFLLVVAERTYKQRFLYAKFFTKLTSSQKARKSELPHFRLNKVKNIKAWLSVRSYLKKRGPQRSVDVIVSSSFVITLLLLSFLSMELLKGSEALRLQYNLEALIWSFGLGIMLLRFMTLANKTYLKYRNLSVLITEQINLYLQIERKPRKKEKLGIVHNVLKLAADLLKELETPYTISGLSANPYLYTIVKVFILSALSAVLSEMLGFKLKLFKLSMKH